MSKNLKSSTSSVTKKPSSGLKPSPLVTGGGGSRLVGSPLTTRGGSPSSSSSSSGDDDDDDDSSESDNGAVNTSSKSKSKSITPGNRIHILQALTPMVGFKTTLLVLDEVDYPTRPPMTLGCPLSGLIEPTPLDSLLEHQVVVTLTVPVVSWSTTEVTGLFLVENPPPTVVLVPAKSTQLPDRLAIAVPTVFVLTARGLTLIAPADSIAWGNVSLVPYRHVEPSVISQSRVPTFPVVTGSEQRLAAQAAGLRRLFNHDDLRLRTYIGPSGDIRNSFLGSRIQQSLSMDFSTRLICLPTNIHLLVSVPYSLIPLAPGADSKLTAFHISHMLTAEQFESLAPSYELLSHDQLRSVVRDWVSLMKVILDHVNFPLLWNEGLLRLQEIFDSNEDISFSKCCDIKFTSNALMKALQRFSLAVHDPTLANLPADKFATHIVEALSINVAATLTQYALTPRVYPVSGFPSSQVITVTGKRKRTKRSVPSVPSAPVATAGKLGICFSHLSFALGISSSTCTRAGCSHPHEVIPTQASVAYKKSLISRISHAKNQAWLAKATIAINALP